MIKEEKEIQFSLSASRDFDFPVRGNFLDL